MLRADKHRGCHGATRKKGAYRFRRHAYATRRYGLAKVLRIGGAMNVDITALGILLTAPVDATFASGKPENTAKNPVLPAGLIRHLSRVVASTGPAPPAQDRGRGQAIADARAYHMPAARRATTATLLTESVTCRGHDIFRMRRQTAHLAQALSGHIHPEPVRWCLSARKERWIRHGRYGGTY